MDSIFDLDHLYRTYFKMALPSVFGLMVSVVYNLADTFFIAQSNNTALIAGVSLCAPVFTALMAFGNIYGQGGSSLISRLLGQAFWVRLLRRCRTHRPITPCWPLVPRPRC